MPPVSYTHLDVYKRQPQEEGGESEGGEDVEEQTGAGTDVRSRLDVRFGLQPVEKDLNRLPQGTDCLLYTSRCV